MRHRYYIVTFKNEKTVFCRCFNKEEAEILSKAVMINHGLSREIESISEMSYRHYQLYFNMSYDVDYVA